MRGMIITAYSIFHFASRILELIVSLWCNKKINSKLLKKEVQEQFRSVRYIVSELFVEAFHATLKSFVWSRHVVHQYGGRGNQ